MLLMWAGRVDAIPTTAAAQQQAQEGQGSAAIAAHNASSSWTPNYTRPKHVSRATFAKLSTSRWVTGTGIGYGPTTRMAAIAMLLTLAPLPLIQVPVLFDDCVLTSDEERCKTPLWASAAAGALCVVAFIGYLWQQLRSSGDSEVIEERIQATSLQALLQRLIAARALLFADDADGGEGEEAIASSSAAAAATDPATGDAALTMPLTKAGASNSSGSFASAVNARTVIRAVFARYDTDRSGTIDACELASLLRDLGEPSKPSDVKAVIAACDTSKDGVLSFDELSAVLRDGGAAIGGREAIKTSSSSSGVCAGKNERVVNHCAGELVMNGDVVGSR